MENLETTISFTTEKKVNVKLPYYCINLVSAFKIIDAQTAIRILFGPTDQGVVKTCFFNSVFNPEHEFVQITESEFLAKYNEIKSLI